MQEEISDQSQALAFSRLSRPRGQVRAIHSALPSEASDFGTQYPQEIGPEQDRRAAEIIPRALHVIEKTAEIEELKAGHGHGNQNGLDYGAAIAGKPEQLLAIERFFAKFSSCLFCRLRARIGLRQSCR